jgi:hypothetical protein
MYRFLLFFLVFVRFLQGDSYYTVDMSFMIVDLKYNASDGIKICEVQHGILSAFKGDVFAHEGETVIAAHLIEALSQYTSHGWFLQSYVTDSNVKGALLQSGQWRGFKSLRDIYSDPSFILNSQYYPDDPHNIFDYHGVLWARPSLLGDLTKLSESNPGIIVMDRATYPYWIDKFAMSALFDLDPELQRFKPRWAAFPKIYSKNLASEIIKSIPSELLVIKPTGAFLGKGVIIVEKENLDSTLSYILNKSKELKHDPDPAYSYWYSNQSSVLLVEEFFPSDPIAAPHLDNRIYQPTMRAAYLLVYHQKTIETHFLGVYWTLPKKSLEELGSLNERHKAFCHVPHYMPVDNELEETIRKELGPPMSILYQQMLENR